MAGTLDSMEELYVHQRRSHGSLHRVWLQPDNNDCALQPGEDATAFRTLNEEWINRYFTLEARDIETLGDPESTILRRGGSVFMAYSDDLAVGCVALIPLGQGVYELSKMAVAPQFRGRGLGRRLLLHAIAEARILGATSLFLGSNTRLADAVDCTHDCDAALG